MNHHKLSADILVAGGGPAGVPCAIAAARLGAKVVLCQDRPVLGGNASSEIRMHIVGADVFGGTELATEAREGGILEEIRLECSQRNAQRSASMLDLILYEKCLAEPNLTLLLNTTVNGVEVEGRRLVSANAVRESTEDQFTIRADSFVDCTGDGRLGAEAGAAFMWGREDKESFGEQHALEKADRRTLGSTLLYQARKHDRPMPFVAPAFARRFSEDDLRLRLHLKPGAIDAGLEYGFWWCEWGGQLDTVKDNEAIRDELLAILMGVWDVIKNSGRYPGVENWALDWFGWVPGKRESRRFIGQHILTENDLLRAEPYPDAIAYGGWPIDLHPPQGVDAPDEPPCQHIKLPSLYSIPLRSCVARDFENLSFAGRNMSATHVAFASTRVMGTCAVMGQGLGTALALAARQGIPASEISNQRDLLAIIQQQLLHDDCFLPGVLNQDEKDLARRATVSASSHAKGGNPELALSGQTRAVHGQGGARSGLTTAHTHRWMSLPDDGLPATLTLQWKEPVTPCAVQIIFDTGLHRKLTLSHSDGFYKSVVWGEPQPETVADYRIEMQPAGSQEWLPLVRITGNYQRVRRHSLAEGKSVSCQALRLVIEKTNGIDHARICEVRVS